MRKINLTLTLIVLSTCATAAFNKTEQEQLIKINDGYKVELKIVSNQINELHSEVLEYFPEKKSQINALLGSWNTMANNKCELVSFESHGTDAEFVVFNECLIAENRKIIKFFESMISMP
ncbi:hypothetical protein [Vibrio sp. TRT 17S01]|uniref:hypothetical protein n=1 Tax=Vibrio sp. TRT 17S01 TaxID=3418505 RepID=UPI003CF6A25C